MRDYKKMISQKERLNFVSNQEEDIVIGMAIINSYTVQ